jgi:hypothetical protein
MGPKLLIAVGEAASSTAQVPPAIRAVVDAATEVFVVAPTLPGRLDWLNSDTDAAHQRADERLRTVLGQLGEMGAEARGAVGSDEPIEAFADAIRAFEPDHLLIALRSSPSSGWQEQGLIERVVERFGLPVTVFQI